MAGYVYRGNFTGLDSFDAVQMRPRKAPVQPCGTRAAYRRHMNRHETPCGPCIEAARIEARNHWNKHKGKR